MKKNVGRHNSDLNTPYVSEIRKQVTISHHYNQKNDQTPSGIINSPGAINNKLLQSIVVAPSISEIEEEIRVKE